MKHSFRTFFLGLLFFSTPAIGAVVPPYAINNYATSNPSRAEKKCIEEGYKITYANCANQTAPADRCPYHDSYYRTCSQEQWCRNNNYRYLATDCKLPTFPVKQCNNKYPMYRQCQEDIQRACTEAGYTSATKCQLTDERCPYNAQYGKCCNACPDFSHNINSIPAGYVSDGSKCTTCDGITKTNIILAPCKGYSHCEYGPISSQTPSCLQGETLLHNACKTAEMFCKDKGFIYTSCSATEDEETCPEHPSRKKCSTNCTKIAQTQFPDADIITQNITNPKLDLTKKSLRSLYGILSDQCISKTRPVVTLNITEENLHLYKNLFNRNISNVNFELNFQTPATLPLNGTLENVRITISGDLAECPFEGHMLNIDQTVSFVDVPNLCANIKISPSAKLITTGNIKGDIEVDKNASLGIKGNLYGRLVSKSYSEIFIKGIILYADKNNTSTDSESIVFGCSTHAKIEGGIAVETANIHLKQRAIVDTPYIKLVSTSNNPDIPNTLSSLHVHKYSRIHTTFDDAEYPITDNTDISCDDKYYIHLGSAVDSKVSSISLEPSERLLDKWTCRSLSRKQQSCD